MSAPKKQKLDDESAAEGKAMNIIGITGTLGAGKGTVVEYLMSKYGYLHYSARGLLNDIIAERQLPPGRDSMRKVANGMRAEKGPAALIEALFAKAVVVGQDAIIESVRTEGEIIALRKSGKPFTLLAVDADQKLRYDRVIGRGSETDKVTFDKFCEQEAVEMTSTKPHEQNLSRCMSLADVRIENNGSVEELHAKVDNYLNKDECKEIVQHVYAGSYTTSGLGWVGSKTPGTGISHFLLHGDGTLTQGEHKVTVQDHPTWLDIVRTSNGSYLIANHEMGPNDEANKGYITSYNIDSTGALQKISTQQTEGRGNTSVAIDRTGKYILTPRYWEGGVTVLPFNPENGEIGALSSKVLHTGSGSHPKRQSSPHPHGFQADPRKDWVYCLDLGTDKVVQYELDTTTGVLSPANPPSVQMTKGSGPRGMVFHPTLKMAYVTCELNGTVVVCTVGEKGLVVQTELRGYPEDFVCTGHEHNLGKADFWGSEAAITPDGRFLYYTCRVHQSLAIFGVDGSGQLALQGRQALHPSSNARNLTIDPTGRFVLVASQDADSVEVFKINRDDGTLDLRCRQHSPCAADVAVL